MAIVHIDHAVVFVAPYDGEIPMVDNILNAERIVFQESPQGMD